MQNEKKKSHAANVLIFRVKKEIVLNVLDFAQRKDAPMKKNKPECNDPYCHTYGRCVRDHKKESSSPVELSIAEKDMCKRFHADAGTLLAWIGDINRKPSWATFERGSPAARVAEAIEDHVRYDDNHGPQMLASLFLMCFGVFLGAAIVFGVMWHYNHALSEKIRKADYAIETGRYAEAGDILNGR